MTVDDKKLLYMTNRLLTAGFITAVTIALVSCDSRMTDTLTIAGKNQTELLKVIDHYTERGDTLKLKAATFLIENMKEHYYTESAAIDSFVNKVKLLETKVDADSLSSIWATVKEHDKPYTRTDAKNITRSLLIDNIDKATECWKKSKWKKDISFDTFCRYILPYRVLHEQLSEGWRDTLYNEYYPLIEGVNDMKQAFWSVHKAVSERFKRTPYDMPYQVDLFKLRAIGKGSCVQYCVYEAAVMRALALPVAIDGVDVWANYSKNGHSWVALVTDDGTYTVAKNDSVARKMNVIDSSVFDMKNKVESDYEYSTSFRKRCFKVIRSTYESIENDYDDREADKETQQQFAYPWKKDVTKEYMPCYEVKISSGKDNGYAYLCSFRTGKGWTPAVYAKKSNDSYVFRDMADSVVYLPVIFRQGEMMPLSNPFILSGGKKIILNPQYGKTTTAKLFRKYPLTAHFINYWPPIKGARFEASNSLDFKNPILLHIVERTPLLTNEFCTDSNRKYRYIRYVSPEGKNPGISELTFFFEGKQIKGIPFGDDTLNDKNYAFDGDYLTQTEAHVPFIFGVDFGKPVNIDKVVYSPKNDANLIIPGNVYELLYFDMGWKSLGKQTANGFSVSFGNVPAMALLLLRCVASGNEERIFTINAGRQIWW